MYIFVCRASVGGALTFEHFRGHVERLVGLLLVDADGLGHHHLAEAALAQRLTQSQPASTRNSLRGRVHRGRLDSAEPV